MASRHAFLQCETFCPDNHVGLCVDGLFQKKHQVLFQVLCTRTVGQSPKTSTPLSLPAVPDVLFEYPCAPGVPHDPHDPGQVLAAQQLGPAAEVAVVGAGVRLAGVAAEVRVPAVLAVHDRVLHGAKGGWVQDEG